MTDIRISLKPKRMYHIWTHASGSENLFRSDENYRYFLEKYTHYIYPVADTFAYCLMPNHLHLTVRFRALEELKNLQGLETAVERFLSRQFSNLFNAYTKAYNKMFDRRGNLFPRFKRKVIDSESYFTGLIAYIHNNPVNHEFVSDPTDWRHSSWHTCLIGNHKKISRQEGIDWFGGAEAFVTFHRQQKNREVVLLFED